MFSTTDCLCWLLVFKREIEIEIRKQKVMEMKGKVHRRLITDVRKGIEEREHRVQETQQAVTKDLTSSSKFSGSCVLTLQTIGPNPS